jgi:hypothetical protein
VNEFNQTFHPKEAAFGKHRNVHPTLKRTEGEKSDPEVHTKMTIHADEMTRKNRKSGKK